MYVHFQLLKKEFCKHPCTKMNNFHSITSTRLTPHPPIPIRPPLEKQTTVRKMSQSPSEKKKEKKVVLCWWNISRYVYMTLEKPELLPSSDYDRTTGQSARIHVSPTVIGVGELRLQSENSD